MFTIDSRISTGYPQSPRFRWNLRRFKRFPRRRNGTPAHDSVSSWMHPLFQFLDVPKTKLPHVRIDDHRNVASGELERSKVRRMTQLELSEEGKIAARTDGCAMGGRSRSRRVMSFCSTRPRLHHRTRGLFTRRKRGERARW